MRLAFWLLGCAAWGINWRREINNSAKVSPKGLHSSELWVLHSLMTQVRVKLGWWSKSPRQLTVSLNAIHKIACFNSANDKVLYILESGAFLRVSLDQTIELFNLIFILLVAILDLIIVEYCIEEWDGMKSLLVQPTHAKLSFGWEIANKETFLYELFFLNHSILSIHIVIALIIRRLLIACDSNDVIWSLLLMNEGFFENCLLLGSFLLKVR